MIQNQTALRNFSRFAFHQQIEKHKINNTSCNNWLYTYGNLRHAMLSKHCSNVYIYIPPLQADHHIRIHPINGAMVQQEPLYAMDINAAVTIRYNINTASYT